MSKPKEYEVTGCAECVFEYDSVDCRHPARDYGDEWDYNLDTGQVQSWCPLRKGPITIRLRK